MRSFRGWPAIEGEVTFARRPRVELSRGRKLAEGKTGVFKPGDNVRLRGPLRMQMTVKSVSAAGVLCEWSNAVKSGVLTVSPESLEAVITPAFGPFAQDVARLEADDRYLQAVAT